MGDAGVVISMLSTAVAALFGALLYSLRQSREDWKGLYESKDKELAGVRLEAAADQRENAAAIRELAAFIRELPRRREDWERQDKGTARDGNRQ